MLKVVRVTRRPTLVPAAKSPLLKIGRIEPCQCILPTPMANDLEELTGLLSGAGFLAADEEADQLLARAAGDVEVLDALVRRRLTGEPLAWIVGHVSFCG